MLLPPLNDYARDAAAYTRPAPPETFNFCDVIDGYAEDPTREALIWLNAAGDERRLTFAEIRDQSKRIASVLRAQGITRGDRVLIMLPRIPEWQLVMMAAFRLGAIAIPCITMLTPKDLRYRIEATQPKAIVTIPSEVAKFDDLTEGRARLIVPYGGGQAQAQGWENLVSLAAGQGLDVATKRMRPDEGALIYFTSGSTGQPKGVLLSAYFPRAYYECSAYWFDLNEQSRDDTMWGTSDTGWSFSLTATMVGPWLAGVRALTYDGPFDPEKRLEIMARYGVTVFAAAASEFRHILGQKIEAHDLTKLRLCATAGESLDGPTARDWMRRAGCRIHEAYGQTEALMVIANYPVTEIKPGAMGLPLPGLPIDVISEDQFTILPANEIGHVAIRMPMEGMMLGYWQAPEKTEDCFVTNHLGERWYITGDLAHKDADGYFWYEGRSDDVINTAGYRVGPAEVEGALMAHPAIKECAAVASPDAERGEVIKAFVVLHAGHDASAELAKDIQSFAKRETAPYKYPRRIAFLDELPKTVTGKIRRKELRDSEYAAAKGK
ncbi:acyl-CoA synthetase [Pararhodobacter oceanensis]|uniref:acyl-CoA synthetase n=1 Tax=Pararhodobacter oceanensis TaxID=2172121 RepID=UPI003A957273